MLFIEGGIYNNINVEYDSMIIFKETNTLVYYAYIKNDNEYNILDSMPELLIDHDRYVNICTFSAKEKNWNGFKYYNYSGKSINTYRVSKILGVLKDWLAGDIDNNFKYTRVNNTFIPKANYTSTIVENETYIEDDTEDIETNSVKENETVERSCNIITTDGKKYIKLFDIYFNKINNKYFNRKIEYATNYKYIGNDSKSPTRLLYTEEEVLDIAEHDIIYIQQKYNMTLSQSERARFNAREYFNLVKHKSCHSGGYVKYFEMGYTVDDVIGIFGCEYKLSINESYNEWKRRKDIRDHIKLNYDCVAIPIKDPEKCDMSYKEMADIVEMDTAEFSKFHKVSITRTREYFRNLKINWLSKDPLYPVFGHKIVEDNFIKLIEKDINDLNPESKEYKSKLVINAIIELKDEYTRTFENHYKMINDDSINPRLCNLIKRRFGISYTRFDKKYCDLILNTRLRDHNDIGNVLMDCMIDPYCFINAKSTLKKSCK